VRAIANRSVICAQDDPPGNWPPTRQFCKRFKQELILARNSRTKSRPSYDLGESDGIRFITMDTSTAKYALHASASMAKFSAQDRFDEIEQLRRSIRRTPKAIHRSI